MPEKVMEPEGNKLRQETCRPSEHRRQKFYVYNLRFIKPETNFIINHQHESDVSRSVRLVGSRAVPMDDDARDQ